MEKLNLKEEIKWAENKINYYTNKIYRKKLKMEIKKQELKTLINNNDLSTEEQEIDLIGDILRLSYKIEELKKDIKMKYEYIIELKEDM